MKAQVIKIRRSTLLSVLLVGLVIAFCGANIVQAAPLTHSIQS